MPRQAPRLRALIGARIVFNNGQATVDCLIRDVSEIGAKLIISAPVPLGALNGGAIVYQRGRGTEYQGSGRELTAC